MNTCDTCKWWRTKNQTLPKSRHRKRNDDGVMVCDVIPIEAYANEIPDNGIRIDGYVESVEWICTGPKFGCIHYEPK